MDKVREQFERVERWHKKFEQIALGKEHDQESDYYQDEVYAFFQNIWHLKDWIIESGALDKKEVDDFFHGNKDLLICKDLANGSKHLVIKNPGIDPRTSISRRSFSLSLGGGPTKVSVQYWIHVDGYPPLDAFSLGTAALARCEAFLKNKNLLQ